MKKLLLLPGLLACVFQLFAQGTVKLTNGATVTTTGNVSIILDNLHIVNDGSILQSPGATTICSGALNVALSGAGTTSLNKLKMSKAAGTTVSLLSNLTVTNVVEFSGGIINLADNVLNLGGTGSFFGESETSRAFTNGLGYVQATGMLNSPAGIDLGKLGAIITTNDNLGFTTIKRGHKQQNAVYGSHNSILRYYDIAPANNVALKATLRFHYFDAELNGIPENTLYQWRSKDLINWAIIGADSRDMTANYVQRMNHSKFDRMTLATAAIPDISCPPNIIASSNVKGCKSSVSFAANATGIPAPVITYRIGNTVISSPYVFPKGTTTVTAIAANGITPDASCTFTVTVVCGPVNNLMITKTGEAITDEPGKKLTLTARPNPTGYYFTLDIRSDDQKPVFVRVTDEVGRLVTVRPGISPNSTLFFGHKLVPGTYFLEAIQGKVRVRMQLVKSGK